MYCITDGKVIILSFSPVLNQQICFLFDRNIDFLDKKKYIYIYLKSKNHTKYLCLHYELKHILSFELNVWKSVLLK